MLSLEVCVSGGRVAPRLLLCVMLVVAPGDVRPLWEATWEWDVSGT
jgi:hypothetical protein